MDIKDFTAGTFIKEHGYKSFAPVEINKEWITSSAELNTLLANANRFLGELNAFSQYIPDVDFFIFMHVVKEATTSSRIEGTQTSIEEALLGEEDIKPERRDDWQEVQNYIKAMNFAIQELEKLPLSNRLLRMTHQILLQGVRGTYKLPGEFRKSQNWIGGATIKDAIFIPPHHSSVDDLMSDLEKFMNNDFINVPHLIRIAIAHYQFETIHPFLDGNGRLGRLLITLYLVSHGLLIKPTLYLSDFFERHRALYYDNLMVVRTASNLEQWIKFFLVGVVETAKKSIATFKSILEIKEKVEGELIIQMGKKAPRAKEFITQLYKKPVTTAHETAEMLKVSSSTAYNILNDFTGFGILKEHTGYKRNRIFVFDEYLSLFQDKEKKE